VSEATPTLTSTPLPPSLTPTATAAPGTADFPEAERFRLGVSIPYRAPYDYDLAALGVGWVMNWQAYAAPPVPPGVEFAQTVRMKRGELSPPPAQLTEIAAANPGALWLISNEPDVRWQDNVTPETYAQLYHAAYTAIKAGDPGAQVAAGGIAQATPLRLQYLDRARAAYQGAFGTALPADAWHIHNYMLREERDSWGVDIPPGFDVDTGMLYSVDDSGNLELFASQLYTFRRWMAAHGYRDRSLIISEFGIPMPADYGFPPERVEAYLWETWRIFLTSRDPQIGHPQDGNRLVQRWCWFSMGYEPYPTGDLFELETESWTSLAEAWMQFVGTER
jgi:hypothetical protein